MLSSSCGSITHTYLYPQVNKGQPRTLALVLIWDWNVCFLGERWKGMMPPATSTQGGKGCSSTMASFHLQDPAKWVQLSCKIETLRHNTAQSSPWPHCTCSRSILPTWPTELSSSQSSQVDGSQLPSATCQGEVAGSGGQAGSPSPCRGEEKALLLLLQQGQRAWLHARARPHWPPPRAPPPPPTCAP